MTLDLKTLLEAGAIILLLLVSAFFSASETALTAASRVRLHQMEQEGNGGAKVVNGLRRQMERLIGAILLANNVVNIAASALATGIFIRLFGDAGVAMATLAMTVLVVVFAEVLPKTYAISAPDRVATNVARPVRAFVILIGPVVQAVEFVVRVTLKLMGVKVDATEILSVRDEIRGTIDLRAHEGSMVKRERFMLGGILDLDEVLVEEVMIHRKNMTVINADDPSAKIVAEAVECQFTRLPLWQKDPDNIIGVLHAKDLLRAVAEHKGDLATLDVLALAQPPWFVPETTSLKEQLDAFRAKRAHFALVVDEYGALMGLVTLEDIIEEIVGDISDEFDVTHRGIRPQRDGSVIVEGTVTVRDLNRGMDWRLPDDRATTIAGLVINEARTIPEVGQSFTYFGYRFNILRRRQNQVTLIGIREVERPENGED
jgi:Mg2+/Co2+ transporter CorB